MPMGLGDDHHTKYHVASSTLWPYYLGCQLLGMRHYASSGRNLPYSWLALGGIRSPPAPLPCSLGEDDNHIPFCNNQGSCKVKGTGLHPCTLSPECDHSYWDSLGFLVQVGQHKNTSSNSFDTQGE